MLAISAFFIQVYSKPKAFNQLEFGQKPVLQLTLSERARAALDNGVSLVVFSRLAVYKQVFGFGFRSSPKQSKFVLQRHALSNRYLVIDGDKLTPKLFASVDEAMDYIANISMIQLESFRHKHHSTAIRVHLDKFDLPSPMRLASFLRQGWHNDTGWVVWLFPKSQLLRT